ncbi:hypothetical protein MCEMAEM19_00183 [Candidatus Pelagibacterales bacterium]
MITNLGLIKLVKNLKKIHKFYTINSHASKKFFSKIIFLI